MEFSAGRLDEITGDVRGKEIRSLSPGRRHPDPGGEEAATEPGKGRPVRQEESWRVVSWKPRDKSVSGRQSAHRAEH